MNTISFQGIEGSFHHEVAIGYFGQDQRWLGRDHFGEVFDDVEQRRAEYGVVAIENSNVGTIVGNLDHFERVNLQIVAEVYLSVQQCLLIHPDATIDSITEVRSHPMALDQCRGYLRNQLAWDRIEVSDTAGAAKWIMDQSATHVAAIGSALAANVYGMSIAARSIQQDATNQTRFWVLANESEGVHPGLTNIESKKGSISFETSHDSGALADALVAMKASGWNLTKIESRPVPEVPWRYRFYCDMELSSKTSLPEIVSSLNSLEQQEIIESSRVLGVYPVNLTLSPSSQAQTTKTNS